ncbi:MAG: winged helix-turn-helix transcriptional regulator [Methanobacteriaceae archaeon]
MNIKKEKGICPVDKAMKLLNKKWNIQIIRDLFFGKKHFKDFKEGKPDLSNKMLSECLKNLESNGLIEKKILNSSPITTEYALTEKGKGLNRVVYELAIFTLEKCHDEEYMDDKKQENVKKIFTEVLHVNG